MTALPATTTEAHEVNDSMDSWLAACSNPSSIDAAPAVLAGLLEISTRPGCRYIENTGCSRAEAVSSLDYIDGASLRGVVL